jgi:GNAT superfamily N-acetyltransferase
VSLAKQNVPVTMTRANLDDVPEFALPAGFSLRWYQPGDEAHWRRIQCAADRFNRITPELFQRQFGWAAARGTPPAAAGEARRRRKAALRDLGERQCYLRSPAGEVIGTGTAWFNDDFEGGRWGRVHWLALLPEFQGRGLGRALLAAVCRRLRDLGHERAYLTTSTARLPALKLYLKFGFAPLIRTAREAAVWRDVLAAVRHTAAAAD